MDFTTIMKAIEIVGAATPAAKQLYDGFRVLLDERDQAKLKVAYAEARDRSDAAHDAVQDELSR